MRIHHEGPVVKFTDQKIVKIETPKKDLKAVLQGLSSSMRKVS